MLTLNELWKKNGAFEASRSAKHSEEPTMTIYDDETRISRKVGSGFLL